MRHLFFIFCWLYSSTILSQSMGKCEALISIFPGGSFVAKTEQLVGDVKTKIVIPIDSLKTGFDLRDKHLREALMAASYTEIKGENFAEIAPLKGLFDLTIKNITKKIEFTFDAAKKNAKFTINLKDFDFKGLKYGVMEVEDEVQISIALN